MALLLQDDNGLVTGANSYVTEADFRAYHAERGNDVTSYSQTQVEQAIIRATSYLDVRFKYIGRKIQKAQTTQWPRIDADDIDDFAVNGIHLAVKKATNEYALRALTAKLMPDPVRDASGYSVSQTAVTVGDVHESKQYSGGGYYNFPDYPEADGILLAYGLIRTGRRISRG